MRDRFELWDIDAGNMIGVYVSESEALAEVRDLLEVNGAACADDLALARRGDDVAEPIAEGAALARLAVTGDQTRRSA
jgi:hypothetical protein